MKKPWVALCSTAIGAIYAAGYFATNTQAAVPSSLTMAQAGLQPSNTWAPSQTPWSSSDASTPTSAPTQTQAATPAGTSTPLMAATSTPPASPATRESATPPPASTPTPHKTEATPQPTSTPAPQKVEATPKPTSTPAKSMYKDGTFDGMGSNRRGSIQVAVTIKSDKITDVQVTRFGMHYSESDIVGLPSEVVSNQSARVRNVSGATYSTVAFEDAVQSALNQARNA